MCDVDDREQLLVSVDDREQLVCDVDDGAALADVWPRWLRGEGRCPVVVCGWFLCSSAVRRRQPVVLVRGFRGECTECTARQPVGAHACLAGLCACASGLGLAPTWRICGARDHTQGLAARRRVRTT